MGTLLFAPWHEMINMETAIRIKRQKPPVRKSLGFFEVVFIAVSPFFSLTGFYVLEKMEVIADKDAIIILSK